MTHQKKIPKQRLDGALVDRGLVPSREQAAVCVVLGRSMDGNGKVFKYSFVCVLALGNVLFCLCCIVSLASSSSAVLELDDASWVCAKW